MTAMARRRARGARVDADAAPREASAGDEPRARGRTRRSLSPSPRGARSLRLLGLWGGYLAVVHFLARASVDELAIRPQPGWHQAPGVPLLARWDAGWYQALADQGYAFDRTQESTAGFFPLYSVLMKATASLLSLGTYQGGVVVSSLCLLAAMYLVHTYARRVGAEPWTAVAMLLALPSSFILASVYSESLFLTCALGSFVLARQDRWRPAAVLAALAALTRVHGIVLIPTLLVDAWLRREGPRPSSPRAAAGRGCAARIRGPLRLLRRAVPRPVGVLPREAGLGAALARRQLRAPRRLARAARGPRPALEHRGVAPRGHLGRRLGGAGASASPRRGDLGDLVHAHDPRRRRPRGVGRLALLPVDVPAADPGAPAGTRSG